MTPSAGVVRRENPLQEGLGPQRTTQSSIVVIFGASGDLTRRKLVPSLFRLRKQGLLPPTLAVVGISRTEFSDEEFRDRVAPDEVGKEWEEFSKGLFYMPGSYKDEECYAELQKKLETLRKERDIPPNVVYYLAVSPDAFPLSLIHI